MSEDISIYKGRSFALTVTATDTRGSGLDLADYEVVGVIKRSYFDTGVLVDFSISESTPASSGVFVASLTSGESAALPNGQHWYALDAHRSGAVMPILAGYANVSSRDSNPLNSGDYAVSVTTFPSIVVGGEIGEYATSAYVAAVSGGLQSDIDELAALTGTYLPYSSTGVFYAANNPSGFITGVDLTSYIATGQTGAFYAANNPSGFITNSALAGYVQSSQTGSFVTSSQTGAFYPASNPSGFITGVNLSSYITTSQTGAFYAASNPSGFITNSALSTYALTSYVNGASGSLNSGISANTSRLNALPVFTGHTSAVEVVVPDENFSVARIDAAQSFTGNQTFHGNIVVDTGTTSLDAGNITTDGNGSLTAANNIVAGGFIGSGGSEAFLSYGLNVGNGGGGNASPFIRFSHISDSATLVAPADLSAAYVWNLPSAAGTIALTSDIAMSTVEVADSDERYALIVPDQVRQGDTVKEVGRSFEGTITFLQGDNAGDTHGKYVNFYTVPFEMIVDGNPPVVGGIPVAYSADATANTRATALAAAIESMFPDFTITVDGGTVIILDVMRREVEMFSSDELDITVTTMTAGVTATNHSHVLVNAADISSPFSWMSVDNLFYALTDADIGDTVAGLQDDGFGARLPSINAPISRLLQLATDADRLALTSPADIIAGERVMRMGPKFRLVIEVLNADSGSNTEDQRFTLGSEVFYMDPTNDGDMIGGGTQPVYYAPNSSQSDIAAAVAVAILGSNLLGADYDVEASGNYVYVDASAWPDVPVTHDAGDSTFIFTLEETGLSGDRHIFMLVDADKVSEEAGWINVTEAKAALAAAEAAQAQADTAYTLGSLAAPIGAANEWSQNQEFNGVDNTAPNQSKWAAGDTTLMVRKSSQWEALVSVHKLRPLEFAAGTPLTGGAGSVTVNGGTLNLTCGATAGGYAARVLWDNLTTPTGSSGAGINFSRKISFSAAFSVNVLQYSACRFVVGRHNTGAPPLANAASLTTHGFGFEIYWNGSVMKGRLIAHDGTTLTTGADVTVGIFASQNMILVESDGAGNISLYLAHGTPHGRPSSTPVSTISGGPTTTNAGATVRCANAEFVVDATNPTSSQTLRIHGGMICIE